MENTNPSMMDLLIETHIGLERQGPGSPEAVAQALRFLGAPEQFSRIADLGCGTGGQTMLLAQHLPGKVTGLDMFPDFIDAFNRNAQRCHLENRVTGVVGAMENLPFDRHSLDLIWSEGAIDNIGFERGLSHWHDFLKPGGFVAVSCPSWLTEEHPDEVSRFWAEAGSGLDSAAHNVDTLQKCGYQFVASFVLPEQCWTKHYFEPRAAAIDRLLEKYHGHKAVREYDALNRHEVELYRKHKQHYGYVFYIGRAI